jgi:GNAT superfamily N-acetyltransferase
MRIVMNAIGIRRISPDDSLEDLTGMLHRAFGPLGRQGLDCIGVDQTVDVTRRRVRLGDCFVAVVDGRVVGTITLHAHDRASPVRWYRKPTVASIHQFAVDPSHQGTGVGQALLRTAENWARCRQYLELALDTPQRAQHLCVYYGRRGFNVVDTVQLERRSYLSAVFSKNIGLLASRSVTDIWPARHPAELAALARSARWSRRRRRASVLGRGEPALVRAQQRDVRASCTR